MALFEKSLVIKRSLIPNAGKGLFTKVLISKGSLVVEYKGKVTTWKEANHAEGTNAYLYFVNRNHVIDALNYKKAMARYANDCRGLVRLKGFSNNCAYFKEGGKVYIKATKDIPAGSEIFVSYGKDYWDVIKKNKVLPPKHG